jgi:hypothetical protein
LSKSNFDPGVEDSRECKTCHLPYIPTSNHQKNCSSCIEKKELLKLQERELRKLRGFNCINICEDCDEPFGASSGYQKRCSPCGLIRCEFEAKERERKAKEGPPLRTVICECGNSFETKSNHRIWCDDCTILRRKNSRNGVVAKKATTASKRINILMGFEKEDTEFREYLEKQHRINNKWRERYRESRGIEMDHSPNMASSIYIG